MRVMIAWASKHGSTAKAAEAIARNLGDLGLEVESGEAHRVGSVLEHEAIVLGAPLYSDRSGSWPSSMRSWSGEAL